MAKYSTNKITSIDTDWSNDDLTGKAYSGELVQQFIKNALMNYGVFHENTIYYFLNNEDMALWISEGKDPESNLILNTMGFTVEGVINRITVTVGNPNYSTMYLAVATQGTIPVTINTYTKGVIEQGDGQLLEENYTVELQHRGPNSSTYTTIATNSSIIGNGSSSFNYSGKVTWSAGTHYFRIKFTGNESGATTNYQSFQVVYTDASLAGREGNWYTPFIADNETSHRFTFFYMSGNAGYNYRYVIRKIKNGDGSAPTGYTAYSSTSSSNITGVRDYIDVPNSVIDSGGSGIYAIKVYLSSGTRTDFTSHERNFMYVAKGLKTTTSLFLYHNINWTTFTNAESKWMFSYAIYDKGNETGNLIISRTNSLGSTYNSSLELSNISTNKKLWYYYVEDLEVENQRWTVYITCNVGKTDDENGFTWSNWLSRPVSNNTQYLATKNASFTLNPAELSNNDSNITTDSSGNKSCKIVNSMNKNTKYTTTTLNMNFIDGIDGFIDDETEYITTTQDDETIYSYRKCLYIPATARMTINGFTPLSSIPANGKTFEFLFKTNKVTNENDAVITLGVDLDTDDWKGIKITGNRVLVRTESAKTDTLLDYTFNADVLTDIIISYVPKAKSKSKVNTCIIFCNGEKVREFPFADQLYDAANNSNIIMGSDTCDLNLYKLRIYDTYFSSKDGVQNDIAKEMTNSLKVAQYTKQFTNILNSSNTLDYTKCASLYNTFLITMNSGYYLPSGTNDNTGFCTLDVKYKDNPTWNWKATDMYVEGQGSSSKKYFVWNLRWRSKKSKTPKIYDYQNNLVTDKVGGAFAYAGPNNGKSADITAKKNMASAMQSHKMGLTAAFNDLHKALVDGNQTTAVQQYPFLGFIKNANGTIEYIGLYTMGADKGDKTYFGFKNEFFRTEGKNFDLKATAFRYPFEELEFVDSEEGYCIKKPNGSYELNWESSYNDFKDERPANKTLLGRWKDAYNMVYHHGLMLLASSSIPKISESNTTWAQETTSDGKTGGDPNRLVKEYDIVYTGSDTSLLGNVYYYNITDNSYKVAYNVFDILGISKAFPTSVSTNTKKLAWLKDKIAEHFHTNYTNYWSKNGTLFEYMFKIINGLSDNFMKNYYPFIIGDPQQSGKGLVDALQDDVDTAIDVNNVGKSIKPFDCEIVDRYKENSGAEGYVFAGTDSNMAQLLSHDVFYDDMREMFASIVNKMIELGGNTGGEGVTVVDQILDFYYKYLWKNAQKYFPKMAYNLDTEYTYETKRAIWNQPFVNNGVDPLQLVTGPHYEAEREWVRKRIIYLMSKYRYNNFGDPKVSSLKGIGAMTAQFNAVANITLENTITMFPVIMEGESGSNKLNIGRVTEGTKYEFTGTATGSTRTYLIGTDLWRYFKCTNFRSDDSFALASDSLETLILGDSNGSTSSCNGYSINCPALKYLDMRYVKAGGKNSLDISTSKRLQEAYFTGSPFVNILLANGGRLKKLYLPSTLTTLGLKNLTNLTDLKIDGDSYKNLTSLNIINNNPKVNVLKILYDCKAKISRIGLRNIVGSYTSSSELYLLNLIDLANKTSVKGLDENDNETSFASNVTGTLNLTGVSTTIVNNLKSKFPKLIIKTA